jgi:hypothetical protein
MMMLVMALFGNVRGLMEETNLTKGWKASKGQTDPER